MDGERLLVVTTRSRLKGPWFFPSMLIASMRVRRQLAASPGVVRWASVIAGPSEFWTITVWETRHEMHEFMRTGAHDQIMWLFSRWLRSFWLMRWRPGPEELGSWNGLTLGAPEPDDSTWRGGGGGDGAGASDGNGSAPGGDDRASALDRALEHLPRLRAATGADGAAHYDSTVFARRRRAEVGQAGGVAVHIGTSPWRTPRALAALRRVAREARSQHGGAIRLAVGVGRPGDVYLLGLWPDREAARRFLASDVLRVAGTRWDLWANEWVPENEFGHWDGLRLRRVRSRYAVKVPRRSRDAAGI